MKTSLLKRGLIGAAALATAVTGSVVGVTPAEAAGFHGGGGHFAGGGGGFRGGYGYRGGYVGYRGGYGYRGGWGYGGWGYGGAVLGGLALGAALSYPYYYGPPGYYAGPYYWGWYGGCRREWVWSPAWGRYHLVGACY